MTPKSTPETQCKGKTKTILDGVLSTRAGRIHYSRKIRDNVLIIGKCTSLRDRENIRTRKRRRAKQPYPISEDQHTYSCAVVTDVLPAPPWQLR